MIGRETTLVIAFRFAVGLLAAAASPWLLFLLLSVFPTPLLVSNTLVSIFFFSVIYLTKPLVVFGFVVFGLNLFLFVTTSVSPNRGKAMQGCLITGLGILLWLPILFWVPRIMNSHFY